jgi:hypothetical protein
MNKSWGQGAQMQAKDVMDAPVVTVAVRLAPASTSRALAHVDARRQEGMSFNPWLIALLAVMPLLILVIGLAAAAGGLDSPAAFGVLVAGIGAAAVAARMAVRAAERM